MHCRLQRELRWAQAGRACHQPQDHLLATGAGLADSKQGHRDCARAGRATGTVPGLAHPWALSKGRARESGHGQGRGGTAGSAQQNWFGKQYLTSTGIIKLPALQENFQSLVTAGFLNISGKEHKEPLNACLFPGHT